MIDLRLAAALPFALTQAVCQVVVERLLGRQDDFIGEAGHDFTADPPEVDPVADAVLDSIERIWNQPYGGSE